MAARRPGLCTRRRGRGEGLSREIRLDGEAEAGKDQKFDKAIYGILPEGEEIPTVGDKKASRTDEIAADLNVKTEPVDKKTGEVKTEPENPTVEEQVEKEVNDELKAGTKTAEGDSEIVDASDAISPEDVDKAVKKSETKQEDMMPDEKAPPAKTQTANGKPKRMNKDQRATITMQLNNKKFEGENGKDLLKRVQKSMTPGTTLDEAEDLIGDLMDLPNAE